jgi:predicted transposase/invertase (TIGR01784 family)
MNHITEAQAKKSISEMNLINGFLFDSALEHEDEAKIIVGNILKAVFFRKFNVESVTSQKPLQSIDTNYHGIRLDVHITEATDGMTPVATVYDMEMEDRAADKKSLPRRLRFYTALHDSKALDSGNDYDKLPDFISIVILSYDPFDAGDMYYEAKTTLITHPNTDYENGVRSIFLYCNGKPNFDSPNSRISWSPEHSKNLQEMLKYIVSGEKPVSTNTDIEEIDTIVTKVKDRKEVTIAYMRQWDRELSIRRETREETRIETRKETKQEDALEAIRFDQKKDIPIEITRERLQESFGYDDDTINELIAQVATESVVSQQAT